LIADKRIVERSLSCICDLSENDTAVLERIEPSVVNVVRHRAVGGLSHLPVSERAGSYSVPSSAGCVRASRQHLFGAENGKKFCSITAIDSGRSKRAIAAAFSKMANVLIIRILHLKPGRWSLHPISDFLRCFRALEFFRNFFWDVDFTKNGFEDVRLVDLDDVLKRCGIRNDNHLLCCLSCAAMANNSSI
jgi:hypothetical protein